MAINFPSSPATNAEYSFNGKTWKYNGTGWALTLGKPYGREVLLADRTYYVATTGSDSNDGLAVGTPFLTIQKAVDTAVSLDRSIYAVTIQVADGTYTGLVTLKKGVGAGALTISGNVATPSNVHVNVASTCFTLSVAETWIVQHLKVTSTSIGFNSGQKGAVITINNVVFGACTHYHMQAAGGTITASGNYSIVGNATYHIITLYQGNVIVGNRTVTLLASVTFTAFVYCVRASMINVENMTFTLGAYTVTGKRYEADGNSVICGTGGNVNYLPGTVAGTTATGAQYI